MAFSPCSKKKFILTDSFLTRLKTEYYQNSRSYGALSLAASTLVLSVLLPLALVPVLTLSSVFSRPVVFHVPAASYGLSWSVLSPALLDELFVP